MGGKIAIKFVLILVLVVALNQVEVASQTACFNACRVTAPMFICARLCGCTLLGDRAYCPNGYSTPQNSEEGEVQVQEFVEDYCKLKCASSICNTILHASAEKQPCYNACSHFCKDSKTAVVTNVA